MIALQGDLGAGKTTLVRALIRSALEDPVAEVPSPTFTLIQPYRDMPFGTLAHLDLYRVEDGEEVFELGIEEALETGVVLVEWPEKARGNLPTFNLTIQFKIDDDNPDARHFQLSGDDGIMARLKRSLDIRQFLDDNGHGESHRQPLTGDASARSYETITPETGKPVILMNSPAQPDGPPIQNGLPYSKIAKLAESVFAFVGVSKTLSDKGMRVPEIYASDLEAGLLIIEDLGTGTIIDEHHQPIADRYRASIETLVALHDKQWSSKVEFAESYTHEIAAFDLQTLLIEVDLMPQWFAPYRLGRVLDQNEHEQFVSIWTELADRLQHHEKSLLLRDYHSPNIIWIEKQTGVERTGLIDFQDALIGPCSYDVASLAQDARVDVSADLEQDLVRHYCEMRSGLDENAFLESYAIMAAQRATKILGIFVRLSQRDGKDAYLQHLPRIEDYLNRSLSHSILKPYREWIETVFGSEKS